jgi:hypothetical protein
VIVTLCGIAASALVNSIPKARSAGALSAVGAKEKALASSARTTGFDVGRGVGFAVGFGVGVGLRVGAGVEVDAGVDVGASVGGGDRDSTASDLTGGGVELATAPLGARLAVGAFTADGDAPIVSLGAVTTLEPGATEAGGEPPQAATRTAAATNRTIGEVGIAAL